MIRPEPRSIMCGSAAWLMKKAPDRLTASTLYQSSSRHLQHGLVDRDAGVVDEDVEPAVLLDHLAHGSAAVIGRADVALVNAGVQPVLAELVANACGVLLVSAVAGGDWRALLGQAAADRCPDAAGAARDQRDAPVRRGRWTDASLEACS